MRPDGYAGQGQGSESYTSKDPYVLAIIGQIDNSIDAFF
jgi:hypothetical protein